MVGYHHNPAFRRVRGSMLIERARKQTGCLLLLLLQTVKGRSEYSRVLGQKAGPDRPCARKQSGVLLQVPVCIKARCVSPAVPWLVMYYNTTGSRRWWWSKLLLRLLPLSTRSWIHRRQCKKSIRVPVGWLVPGLDDRGLDKIDTAVPCRLGDCGVPQHLGCGLGANLLSSLYGSLPSLPRMYFFFFFLFFPFLDAFFFSLTLLFRPFHFSISFFLLFFKE